MSTTKKYSAVERALAIGRKKYGYQRRGNSDNEDAGSSHHRLNVSTTDTSTNIKTRRANHDENYRHDIREPSNSFGSRRGGRNNKYSDDNMDEPLLNKNSRDIQFTNKENSSRLNIIDDDTINLLFSNNNCNSNTPSQYKMKRSGRVLNRRHNNDALFENATDRNMPLPTFKDIDRRIDDLFLENANFLKENFSKSHDIFHDATSTYGKAVEELRSNTQYFTSGSKGYPYGKFTVGYPEVNTPSGSVPKDAISNTTLEPTDLNHISDHEYDENVDYKLKLANLVDSLSREVEVLKNNSSVTPTVHNIVSPSSSKIDCNERKKKLHDTLYETSTGLVITVPAEVNVVDEIIGETQIPAVPSSANKMFLPPPPPPTISMSFATDDELSIYQFDISIKHFKNRTYRKYFDGIKLYYLIRKHIFLRMKTHILSRPCRKWEGVGFAFSSKEICIERGQEAMAKEYVKQRLLKICFAKLMLNVHVGYEDFVVNVLPPPLLETPPCTPKQNR